MRLSGRARPARKGLHFIVALLLVVAAMVRPVGAGVWDSMQRLLDAEARTTQGQAFETVVYTPPEWPQALAADLYLPPRSVQAPGPHAVVLLLHGGAWQRGDKASLRGLGQTLANRGYVAMAIEYRLAPGARYPAQLQDMQQAVRWLTQHAARYQVDMDRLATWGYSAGGHLAALLAVQPPSDLPSVRVVIAGGAPSDLRAAPDIAAVHALLGGGMDDVPALYEQASPIAHVRPGLASFFLYHGTADEVVPPVHSAGLAQALDAAGVPVEVVWLEGLDHDEAAQAPQIRPAALAFLDRAIVQATTAAVLTSRPWYPAGLPALRERADAGLAGAGASTRRAIAPLPER